MELLVYMRSYHSIFLRTICLNLKSPFSSGTELDKNLTSQFPYLCIQVCHWSEIWTRVNSISRTLWHSDTAAAQYHQDPPNQYNHVRLGTTRPPVRSTQQPSEQRTIIIMTLSSDVKTTDYQAPRSNFSTYMWVVFTLSGYCLSTYSLWHVR